MAKEKIRIKPPHALSSLAGRAVVVSLCLLVIPLFLHSLFLYRQEYKSTLADVKAELALTARAQKALLEERIHFQWQVLDAAATTGSSLIQPLKISVISQPRELADHFVLIDLDEKAFYVGRKISGTKALAITNSIDQIFEQLSEFEIAKYPFFLSFINAKGRTIFGAKQESALSVKLPIVGAQFFLSLSASESAIEKLHKEWYFYHFLTLLFFIGVIGGFLVWMITRRIAKPLGELCKVMQRVGEGASHTRYQSDRMGFEINELGKQFNQTLDQLLEHRQKAEKERIERERIAGELKIGHDIQASLLPSHLPESNGLNVAAGFLPALEVSGDFYDLFVLQDGKLMIVIADTAGKGISACLYSLGLRSMLRALASFGGKSLSEIVLCANDLFWRDARHEGTFVTLWIGIYDPATHMLEYCSQGHPPAYLIWKNQCKELWTAGIAMGAQALDAISTKQLSLQGNETLFLYTDGIIEAHNSNHQLFGRERLKDCLVRSSDLSPRALVDCLLKELSSFCCAAPQHDDMTLLVVKFSSM